MSQISVAGSASPGRSVHFFDPATGAYRTSVAFPGGSNLQVDSLSLAADGGTVAVGVNCSGFGPVPDSAAVYLYDARTGALRQTITGAGDDPYFALDVAIAGDRVLVGSPNEDDTGRAYLYDAGSGDLLRTIEHPAPDPDYSNFFPGNFGAAVAITEDRVVIGDQQSSVSAQGGGAAYVLDAEGEHVLEILTDADPGGTFGAQVAAVGETVAVATPNAGRKPVPGALYLYRDEPESAGGADHLYGGAGDDLLHGGGGADLLYGAAGGDVIGGGPGNDWVSGGPGNDVLTGGLGNDGFVLSGDWGRDVITDFEEGELIFVRNVGIDDPARLDLDEVDGDAVLGLGVNSLTLWGIVAADVQDDWFLIA